MADNYISTNMESGVKVKEALERIESYEPGLFVWTEVSDSVTVNLKSPTTYSGIKDPGDYVIYKFSNGPAKIPSTLAPVLLSLRNGEICVTANNMVFMLNGDNWVDMSESTDTDTTIFVKSDIAPVRTKNCYWFDTSKYAAEGYITLKYYDTDTSTWTSVFNEERYLKKSELDPDNKNTDVYDYITTKVAGVVGEYGEFMKHVANQLTYIHVSADDRKAYGKIITKDQLQTLLEKTYTPAVKTVIDQAVSDGLGTTALENSLTNLKDNITSHLEGHVTAEDITRWKNKAEKNHTHDYTQGSAKLDASQIVSGTFGEDQLPDEIKERYYKITAASPAAEFSSSSITAAMRKGKYHNGNGFYFEMTDSETGKVTRQWYRIIDSSKVGTSNWAQGVVDFTATEVNLDWDQISGKPSSLEEFGITTDLYTKTEIDEKFSSYDSNITELNKDLESANEEVSYEFGIKDCPVDLDSLSVGSTFTLGKYQVESEDPWDIEWEIVHQTDDYQIAMTKSVIDLRCFDGKESTNNDSNRAKYGNNNWKYSNIKQFLNSDQANWYSSQHQYDAPPSSANCWSYTNGTTYNAYDTHKGFLYYWSDTDKSILKDMTLTLATPTVDGGGSYTWTDKVWLPTYTQMSGGQNNSISEGEVFSKFTDDNSRIKYLHPNCAANNEHCKLKNYTSNNNWYYWMSSASTSGSSFVRRIGAGGAIGDTGGASTGFVGLAPCICLPRSSSQLYGKIDRIGLQIRKDSTTFSDNATGSIPQIDAIIKTTDGKIYKATQNLNSTYTDYNGNKTTTSNAAEPVGASMCEKFVKEYEWRNTDNLYYSDLTYGNNIYVCNVVKDNKNQIMYSKNGKSWNTAIGTNLPGIVYSIDFCNNMFIATTVSYRYAYSTDGINWTQKTINENYHFMTNIYYANGKYVAFIENNDGMYNTYSTDLTNWTIGSKNTMSFDTSMHNDLASSINKIAYGNTKFIAVGEGLSNSSNMLYSTDGINWTEGMISSFPYNWVNIKYINGKFYALGDKWVYNGAAYRVIAYSSNGINWTIPTLKWSDNTEINIDSGFDFCKFDDTSLIGYFYNNSWDDIVLAKSTDGITWTKIYSLGTNQIPNGIVYTKDGVAMTSSSDTIVISYLKLLHYSWTVNAKSGQTFTSNNINDDTYTVLNTNNNFTDTVTVDDTYDSNSIDEHPTGAYRFSGWSQTGNITFTKDTPRVTEITGTWNWVDMVKYSYSWNAPSYSDLTGLVTLPTGGSAYAGDTVSVDTKYNSDSKIDVLNWNYANTSKYKWHDICYGNGLFIIIEGKGQDTSNEYNNYAYSTDGITWTEGTLPVSKCWQKIYYLNNKFIITGYGTGIILYSSDGINWTESTVRSNESSIVLLCYGNGKYISVLTNNWSSKYTYSTDLVNWKEGQFPSSGLTYGNVCLEIVYGNGKFVILGYEDNGSTLPTKDKKVFYVSSNGINWDSITPNWFIEDNAKSYFGYITNKFVWFRYNSPEFFYSEDFENWSAYSYEWDSSYDIYDLIYGSGVYLLNVIKNSDIQFWYSFDGIKWVKSKSPSSSILWPYSMCYGNQKFIVCSDYDESSKQLAYLTLPTSYYQFSGWNPSTDFIINENKTISGTWSKKNKLKVSYSWSNQPSGMKSKVPSDEYYHYGDNVMVDTTYNNKSGYKEESFGQSSAGPGSLSNINDDYIASSSAGYITSTTSSCTSYPKYIIYSTNGTSWSYKSITSITGNSDLDYVSFISADENGLIFGIFNYNSDTDVNTNGYLYRFANSKWTKYNMTTPDIKAGARCICYGNGIHVLSALNNNYIFYSTNGGITWQQSNYMSTRPSVYKLYYGNGKFIGTGRNSNIIYYSTDAITWKTSTIGTLSTYWDIAAGNGLFIAHSNNGTSTTPQIGISSDGITWTISDDSNSSVYKNVYGLSYSNGYFCGITYDGTDTYTYCVYTTDGIAWKYFQVAKGPQWASGTGYNSIYVFACRNNAAGLRRISLTNNFYQFSGWNKSDFNITADTSITASWNTVSSGDGLNFID